MVINTPYNDFSAGECSPRFYGRFDTAAYYKSCRRLENFICDSIGGAGNRTGQYYVARTYNNSPAYLYKFSYTDAVSFVLEFTETKLRFYRNGAQVRNTAQNITAITKANPAVVTYSGSDTYANGDSVYFDNIVGMTELNGMEFTVAGVNTGANTFQLSGVDSTAYTTYVSGGTIEEIVELTTPYQVEDLFQLKFVQDRDVLYIAHNLYNPKKLTYTSPTSWAIADHSPIRKSRGIAQLISAVTLANPAVVTYTGSDTFTNGDTVYIDNVSGMTQINEQEFTIANVNAGANTFELSGIDSTGYAAYTGGGLVRKVTSAAAPFLSSGEYPGTVGVYEQRLVYSGSVNQPIKKYYSKPDDFDDFSLQQGIDPEADDGLEYVPAGGVKIVWLKGTDKFLGVGDAGDVFQVSGGIDGVVTSTSISTRPSNTYGAADMMPIGKGNTIFYVQSNGLTVRSLEYDLQQDGRVAFDRNAIADHITSSGIKQIDYQDGRPNILWAAKNNGQLIGMTFEQGEAVSGWHRHTTEGEVVSIASLPRQNNYDQLWLCVKRVVGGVDNYFIEYMVDEPSYPMREDYVTSSDGTTKDDDYSRFRNMLYESQKEYIYLDSALSYYGDQIGIDATASITPDETTGDGVTFTSDNAVFTSDMVGRNIVRKSVTGDEQGVAEIVTYTNSTTVICDILEDFDSTNEIPYGEWFLTTDTVAGAYHLEGETIQIVADGARHNDVAVEDGAIALDVQASVVHIGLGYTAWLETNDLEGGSNNGTSQTKQKNVIACGFRFLNTLYAKYGTTYYTLNDIEMRTADMRMDRPPELFTGDLKEIYANESSDARSAGWSRSKRAIVCQDRPFPCKVQLITPYFQTGS